MNADIKFVEWIAAVDLLCLEAWQVNAYAIGPQPWEDWHARGWTPERALMELSTPAAPAVPETEQNTLLDRPIPAA